MQVFKESLECPILRGGVIVSTENVKGVSGYIVDILEVHNKIKVTHVYIDRRLSSEYISANCTFVYCLEAILLSIYSSKEVI